MHGNEVVMRLRSCLSTGAHLVFFYDVRYYVHVSNCVAMTPCAMSPKSTSLSDARKNIFTIADEVQKPDNHYILTENGRAKAVIMSAKEYESWKETLEVIEEFPDVDKDLRELRKDVTSGAYAYYPTIEDLLVEEGFVVAEKASPTYEVRCKSKAKRAKRARKSSPKSQNKN